MPISPTQPQRSPTEQQIRAFAESDKKTLHVADGQWKVELPQNRPSSWSVRGFLKNCDAWCERRVESLQRWAAGALQWAGQDVLADVSALGRSGHKDFTTLSLKEQKILGGLHAAYRAMASEAGEVKPPPLRELHPKLAARELLVNIARIRGDSEIQKAHETRKTNAAKLVKAVNSEFQARFQAGTMSVESGARILAATTVSKMGYEAQALAQAALGPDLSRGLLPDYVIRLAVAQIVDDWTLKLGPDTSIPARPSMQRAVTEEVLVGLNTLREHASSLEITTALSSSSGTLLRDKALDECMDKWPRAFDAGTLTRENAHRAVRDVILRQFDVDIDLLAHGSPKEIASRARGPRSQDVMARHLSEGERANQSASADHERQADLKGRAQATRARTADQPSATWRETPTGQDPMATRLTNTARAWERRAQAKDAGAPYKPLPELSSTPAQPAGPSAGKSPSNPQNAQAALRTPEDNLELTAAEQSELDRLEQHITSMVDDVVLQARRSQALEDLLPTTLDAVDGTDYELSLRRYATDSVSSLLRLQIAQQEAGEEAPPITGNDLRTIVTDWAAGLGLPPDQIQLPDEDQPMV